LSAGLAEDLVYHLSEHRGRERAPADPCYGGPVSPKIAVNTAVTRDELLEAAGGFPPRLA